MRVLVTGAAGTVGRRVADELAGRGHEVVAMLRRPERLSETGFELVEGDLSDPGRVEEAARGCDAVFLLLTADGSPEMAGAMERLGIRVVALSDGTRYPIEDALRERNIALTVIHPAEFMKNNAMYWSDSIRGARVAAAPYADSPQAQIDELDVGDCCAACVIDPSTAGGDYTITGPSVTTSRERAKIIGEVIGQPVSFVEWSDEEARAAFADFGMPSDYIEFTLASLRNPEPYMYTVTDDVERLTGHPARSFREWANRNAEAFWDFSWS